MGSKTSRAKRPLETMLPTSLKTKAAIVPGIPQDIIEEILDHLGGDLVISLRARPLQSCALVSKSWVQPCRHHLFRTIFFTSVSVARWLETFPVPEESPVHYVRSLLLSFDERIGVPEDIFEYVPWFTNVVVVAFGGSNNFQSLWTPSYLRLPQSATSLRIRANALTLP